MDAIIPPPLEARCNPKKNTHTHTPFMVSEWIVPKWMDKSIAHGTTTHQMLVENEERKTPKTQDC
jgi:hypothetical protein